jgi:hypothetical protein
LQILHRVRKLDLQDLETAEEERRRNWKGRLLLLLVDQGKEQPLIIDNIQIVGG